VYNVYLIIYTYINIHTHIYTRTYHDGHRKIHEYKTINLRTEDLNNNIDMRCRGGGLKGGDCVYKTYKYLP
jgi:hypothetical protein